MPAEATGIHTHATKKLGRRPPSRRAAVDAGLFLRVGALPDHPLTDPIPPLSWPMDRNDVAGDCVVAGLDHALQTIYAALGVPRQNWSDSQLLSRYQTQNPGFRTWADGGGPDDRGMEIQTFLEYLITTGDITAFGRLDPANTEQMKAATWVGLAVITGEDLRKAQQNQTVWDYVANSGDWGGHCTTTVGYSNAPDEQAVVTWGEVVETTEAFQVKQVDEAWFVLTPAHVAHPGFRDGFDLQGFANAVAELTNGKIIIPVPPPSPVPPPPGPTPPPPPPLPDVLADFPFGALDVWSAHPSSRTKAPTAARAYLNWKHAHGL